MDLRRSTGHGHAAQETREAFLRARELFDEGTPFRVKMGILAGIHAAHSYGAEHRAALGVDQQIFSLATHQNDARGIRQAHLLLGSTHWWLGNFEDARRHLWHDLDSNALEGSPAILSRVQINRAYRLLVLSRTLFALGNPEQAASVSVQLLEHARECRDPVVLAPALTGDCYLGILGTASEKALAAADKAATVCVEHGLPGHELWMRAYHGVFVAEMGNPVRGISIMRDALTALQKISTSNIDRPLWLSRLAMAHASLGQIDVCLDLLAASLEEVEATRERCFEAEIYRRRGEIFLKLDKLSKAEDDFKIALKVARLQKARCWELRAATRLARIWREQGKHFKARDLLSPVYGWFTEGFETIDLKDAKTLLAELSEHPAFTA